MKRYWASAKICIRNKYIITDGTLWCDMINALLALGMDTRNPKYVCPADLKAAHDKWMMKRRQQAEREQAAAEIRKAMQYEDEYRERKGALTLSNVGCTRWEKQAFHSFARHFIGIHITDGTLDVRVLESVKEFVEEGRAMHHCVWANAYYKKDDALILTATINGKRIETVEVSLTTMEVVQSRGVNNTCTEYHDRIVSLINGNM